WTFVSVEGEKPWTIGQYQGNHYANANGYNGGVNEQWCISPAFSLNVYSNASLSFRNAKNYTGPDMQVLFSNDYDGENPVTATWVELEYTMSTGSYTWVESGSIDLANFTGDECYLGFKYTSTETEAAAWEVDDITLMGFTTDPYLTVTPNALSGFNYIVGNGPSAVQTFTVSGGNLPPAPGGTTGGITITCSNTHYEFSLDGEEFWPYTISIQATGTLEPTTVYVRLEAGLYVGQWDGVVTFEDGGLEVTATVSGTVIEEPVPGGDWNRIYALSDLHDGDQVILASRYDATVGDGYYAMTAGVSGKPDGVLFTSVNDGSNEILPAEISDDADTYLWNVTVDGDVITLTNAAGDMLGYSSSTNFAANTSTDWYIALETSEEGALIPNYTGFVITNAETTNRGIAKNSNNKFGAYATSNMSNPDYNFYLDLFVYGGSVTPVVATPVFSFASGTYYESIDVEITCATEDAMIFYTTDGSDPTSMAMLYMDPIHVDADMTLKAIAIMEGYENSAIATANYVIMSGVDIILSQDWEGDMYGWTFVTIEGNKPWVVNEHNGNHYANANGYGDEVDNEQWCISPAFDLSSRDERNVTLTFKNAMKFNGPALELYVSEDYDGQDPTAATWEPLDYIASEGNYVWTESGEISLNEYAGSSSCHIGFRYISTIDEGAASWEIDDILIVADKYDNVVTSETSLNVEVWNSYNALMITNNSDSMLDVAVYNLVGQPVLSETVATGSNVIRHDLVEGVYIVRIANGKEMKGIKVVVRR
ncbi:MAG: choice-of-anchor J domain-containing protein, partial [Bacteroidales bacterium]|nr:choice-of-anchor J domain-containing protein [Bacteroidales bacterium]